MGEVPAVVLACLGIGETVPVIAELGQHPGAEDHTEAGLAGVDLSVPVTAKMVGHHLAQLGDLAIHGGDEPDLAGHDGRERRLYLGGLTQRRRSQHRLDRVGFLLDIAAVGTPQHRCDPRLRQPRGPLRIRRDREQLETVASIEITEGLQRCREELPQHPTQPQHMPGAVPDQALVGTGHELDRLAQLGVPGHRAVMRAVQPHDLGQHMRIPGIRLSPRRGVPLPIAGHRHRIDREHLIAGSDQRLHPLPAVGLDPDLHPRRRLTGFQLGPLFGDQLPDQPMKTSDPVQPLR